MNDESCIYFVDGECTLDGHGCDSDDGKCRMNSEEDPRF